MVRFLFVALLAAAVVAPVAGGSGRVRVFASTCGFSHMSNDDPIVWPGRPGYSHSHTFVGNASTNAFSTLTRLRRAGTSCSPSGDKAAYWAPTLFVDGQPVKPVRATIYYRRLTSAPVHALPAGLRMVAGNSRATRPQSPAVTFWDCSLIKTRFYGPNLRGTETFSPAESSSIPTCPPGTSQLQLHVNFPECWDGKHLDSPNHKSHMAYATAGRCPADHPVALPAISLVYRYPADGVGAGRSVFLASGGQYSGHADFVNAWDERALTTLVETCLDAQTYCLQG